MATQRNTFQKRQRERDRQQKQAMKRARRLEKNDLDPEEEAAPEAAAPAVDQGKLLEELAEIHRLFDDEQIDFDTFEQRKADITAQLTG
ncbi:MAG TPA: hypothetical protein VHA73_12775 [Acidimicrobiales bacterium]|jgi:hypothetical protein|nr:hypothetical protein [Acidimicrobiales bacterium]